MNILVTGATGFIAAQIVTDLLNAGHQVTCAVRDVDYAKNIFPTAKVISCNFICDTNLESWKPRLKDIDVVINCVGILYHPNKKIIWSIHYDAPKALFDACAQSGVKRIIQISALGCDKGTVEYAKSKKAAEDYLLTLPIKSIILRPSLVYGRGSYGGTSLFRGLAGLPAILPVPGTGEQEFQPIHLQDLSKAIINLLTVPLQQTIILSAVGPKRTNLKNVLSKIRAWLGFAKARCLFIPLKLIQLGSLLGDFIPYSAMNTTSYKMLIQNNITSEEATKHFHEVIGFVPRDFEQGVYSEPSTVQDHWHARLYFLKPLLQLSIGAVWVLSGALSLLFSRATGFDLLAKIGVNDFWQPILFYGSSALDIILGLAVLFNFKIKKICSLQIIILILYSVIISCCLPYLWLDPFGAILKNIPLLVATLIFLAMDSDR